MSMRKQGQSVFLDVKTEKAVIPGPVRCLIFMQLFGVGVFLSSFLNSYSFSIARHPIHEAGNNMLGRKWNGFYFSNLFL